MGTDKSVIDNVVKKLVIDGINYKITKLRKYLKSEEDIDWKILEEINDTLKYWIDDIKISKNYSHKLTK